MSVSANYRMADRLAGGNLETILRSHAADGKSYDAIARQLYADYGIEVTRQTVGRWLSELPPTDAAEATG